MFAILKNGDEYCVGRCEFAAREQDLSLTEWSGPTPGASVPGDAHEFGLLAHKRWQYYRSQSLAVDSLAQLKERIRNDSKVEVGLLCLMKAKGLNHLPPLLGLAFFRRTWANHLCIDFLTTHPAIPAEVKGVGVGLLDFIVSVGEEIEAGSVWGETTSRSVGFYRKVFAREGFSDRFSLPRSRYRWFRSNRLEEQLRRLKELRSEPPGSKNAAT